MTGSFSYTEEERQKLRRHLEQSDPEDNESIDEIIDQIEFAVGHTRDEIRKKPDASFPDDTYRAVKRFRSSLKKGLPLLDDDWVQSHFMPSPALGREIRKFIEQTQVLDLKGGGRPIKSFLYEKLVERLIEAWSSATGETARSYENPIEGGRVTPFHQFVRAALEPAGLEPPTRTIDRAIKTFRSRGEAYREKRRQEIERIRREANSNSG